VQQARAELAAELVADLRRVDALLRETKKKPAVAVPATGTSVTGLFGVGPVIAATVIGDVRDVSRFSSRDRFAAYNGTAPIEVSSGSRVIHRLSLRGNRRLNHAIHMAAITQIRYKHSDGRTYYAHRRLARREAPQDSPPREHARHAKRAAEEAESPIIDEGERMPCIHLDQCVGCDAGEPVCGAGPSAERARLRSGPGSPARTPGSAGGSARPAAPPGPGPLPCDPGRVADYVTGR
jgi:transposase